MKDLVRETLFNSIAASLAALALVVAVPVAASAQADRIDGGVELAFAGPVPLTANVTPAGPLAPGTPFEVEIVLSTGAAPLGAWSVDFRCDAAAVSITGVLGGNTAEFAGIPINAPATACGRNIAGFQASSLSTPTGDVSVARIQMEVAAGAPGGVSLFQFLDPTATTADDLAAGVVEAPADAGVEVVVCGDGVVGTGEDCDDGDTLPGDCCSSTCTFEIGPCSDGDACTEGDVCAAGVCDPGPAPNCDDGNACTDDSCDAGSGCVNTNNAAPCEDGDACTEGDVCGGGVCVPGAAPNCDDGNACTDDSCDAGSGCVNTNNAAPCEDGDACTENDMCAGGVCVPGAGPNCDDGNACTDDSCDAGGGCVNTNNTAPCDDVDACTENDMCSGGVCVPGAAPNCDDGNACTDDSCDAGSGCVNTNNAAPCEDGDACTENDMCAGGVCVPGAGPNCDDGNACTDDSCDAGSGCVNTNNAAPCEDGDACTEGDVCGGGVCVPGAAPNCDDGNACTDDSCDAGSGCVNTNNAAPCEDGDACTENDMCAGGVCVPGAGPNCDDGNACTDDSCDAGSGCVNTNNAAPCEDGDACTEGDVCGGGVCVPGAAPNCDDGNACTDDSCDAGSGCVNTNNAAPCEDGDACTENDMCAGGVCVPGAGPDCDDGNACTDDSCDAGGGCVNTNNAAPCEDGDACTEGDVCGGGVCVPGAAPNCDDGNACTDDSCDAGSGCVNANNADPCDDGDACTENDVCSGGACTPGTPIVCDDMIDCTIDTCTGGVCSFNAGPCSAAVVDVVIPPGEVAPGATVTAEITVTTAAPLGAYGLSLGCDPAVVEFLTPVQGGTTPEFAAAPTANLVGPCDLNLTAFQAASLTDPTGVVSVARVDIRVLDAAAFGSSSIIDVMTNTLTDTSAAAIPFFENDGLVQVVAAGCGDAIVQAGEDCDDGNTTDGDCCSSVCAFEAGVCDDGDACTDGDVCGGGVCVPGAAPDCDDGNACTDDSCDSGLGCVNANNADPCDDGDACTENDMCGGGTCGGAAIDCSDGNPCTDDVCDAGGCSNPNNMDPCDDGDGCTVDDVCDAGVCMAGGPNDCDDGNACTVDSCVAGACVNDQSCGATVSLVLPVEKPGPGQTFEAELVIDTSTVPLGSYTVMLDCDPAILAIVPPVLGGNTAEFAAAPTQNLLDTCSLLITGFQAASLTEPTGVVSVARIPIRVQPGAPFNAMTDLDLTPTVVSDTTGNPLGAVDVDATVMIAASVCGDGIVSGLEDCDDGNVVAGDCCSDLCEFEIGACEDGTNCTVGDMCELGVCAPGTGPACDDGLNCTLDDCDVAGGTCVNTPIVCDDGEDCTLDECDEQDGCEFTPIVGFCDDGDDCTEDDACDLEGGCVGAPIDCDDGNGCTTDTCLTAAGCVNTPNANPCDDGNPCTDNDTCLKGNCVGVAVGCDDGDACTVDSCNASGGCLNEPIDCGSGTCNPGTGMCEGGDLVCVAGYQADVLLGDMATSADYADGDDNDAVDDSLAPMLLFANSTKNAFSGASGDEARYTIHLPDAGPWYLWGRFYYPGAIGSNDANSFFASIDGGALLKFGNNKDNFQDFHWDGNGAIENGPLSPLSLGMPGAGEHTIIVEKREVLPDGFQPRLDVFCVSKDGANAPDDGDVAALLGLQGCTVSAECDDGNACTTDSCSAGMCVNAPVDCDDGDACTTDTCDAATGGCSSTTLACDDGDACNGVETCDSASGCEPGTPVNCIDGDACTHDACDMSSGVCSNPVVDCDDNNPCTADSCDSVLGCANELMACPGGETCNPATGLCDAFSVCIAAGSDGSAVFSGKMVTGLDFTGGDDADPNADNLTSPLVFADSKFNSFNGDTNATVSYMVELPDEGPWYLWGRFYFPGEPGSNDANSFFAVVDDGDMMKFGNNKGFFQVWHWDGDGDIENGPVFGLPLPGVGAGAHELVVKKREVTPEGFAPRIDVICFTKDGEVPPDDGDF